VHCCEHVFASREKGTARIGALIVTHDYLGPLVAGVALAAQELRYIRDILVAASKCVFASHVVDAY
jgi:hypothetical protein